jgi:hypothetical protein
MATNFTVNGKAASTDAPPATPLLWVIREGLGLTGTKFGCGTGLCGACMVHIDGKRAYACQTQVSDIAGKSITTIEGLSADSSHPVQKAWLAEQVPQSRPDLSESDVLSSAQSIEFEPLGPVALAIAWGMFWCLRAYLRAAGSALRRALPSPRRS